ncbi:MAG: hypothetical protein ABSB15_03200 [Bryobacteraceae bacterium]
MLRRTFLLGTAAALAAGAQESSEDSGRLGSLAWIRNGTLWIKRLPDGLPRELAGSAVHQPKFSPSGRWIRTLRQGAAVQENPPVGHIREQNRDESGCLNDASGSLLRLHGCYRSEGHAGDGHEALAHPILPLGVKRCRPRSNFVWLEIGDDISGKGSPCSLPESREVGFSVGGPRGGSAEIGFPVGSARDARSLPVQPLSLQH